MPFYFRKAINLGLLRLNLSKTGIGVSGGVTGFRIGVNSKGRTYIHAGRGGLYYHSSLPLSAANKTSDAEPRNSKNHVSRGPLITHGSPPTRGIDGDLLSRMAKAINHRSFLPHATILALLAIAMLAIVIPNGYDNPLALVAALISGAIILCTPFLIWVSAKQAADTRVSLTYSLDKQSASQWHDFCQVLIAIQASGIKVLQGAATVANPKYHGGENRVLETDHPRINVDHRIRNVSCNIATPAIESVSGATYIFFPNFMVCKFGTSLIQIKYDELSIETGNTRISQYNAPRDANVVGQTWQFVNKDGSLDRRFKDNPQLLIVEYATIRITTAAGMDHVLFILSESLAGRFVNHLKHLATLRAHCPPQYQNPAIEAPPRTLEARKPTALANSTRKPEADATRSTDAQDIYTIALQTFCCIVFSDGTCSRPERDAIAKIITRMKSPWSEKEILARIRSHWDKMLQEGFDTFLSKTCNDLKRVNRESHKRFMLKQLAVLSKENVGRNPTGISAYKQLRAALSLTEK